MKKKNELIDILNDETEEDNDKDEEEDEERVTVFNKKTLPKTNKKTIVPKMADIFLNTSKRTKNI